MCNTTSAWHTAKKQEGVVKAALATLECHTLRTETGRRVKRKEVGNKVAKGAHHCSLLNQTPDTKERTPPACWPAHTQNQAHFSVRLTVPTPARMNSSQQHAPGVAETPTAMVQHSAKPHQTRTEAAMTLVHRTGGAFNKAQSESLHPKNDRCPAIGPLPRSPPAQLDSNSGRNAKSRAPW